MFNVLTMNVLCFSLAPKVRTTLAQCARAGTKKRQQTTKGKNRVIERCRSIPLFGANRFVRGAKNSREQFLSHCLIRLWALLFIIVYQVKIFSFFLSDNLIK